MLGSMTSHTTDAHAMSTGTYMQFPASFRCQRFRGHVGKFDVFSAEHDRELAGCVPCADYCYYFWPPARKADFHKK